MVDNRHKWRPPPLDCVYLAEGKRLFKEKKFALAVPCFRKCLEQLSPDVVVTTYTTDEIILSTRLFLLRSLWIQSESDTTYVDQTLTEVQSILMVLSKYKECRFVLLKLTCYYIARITNDDVIYNGASTYLSEKISDMGIQSCQYILNKATSDNTSINERKALYEIESDLHERKGNLQAAAESTIMLLKDSPNIQMQQKRLRSLHIRLGIIDVDAEKARREFNRQQRQKNLKNRGLKQAQRLGGILDRLEPDVSATLSRPPTYNFFTGLDNLKCTPVNKAEDSSIDWSMIPEVIRPDYSNNKNKERRLRRKKNQLEALYILLRDLVQKASLMKGKEDTFHIVDFGSGSGNSCLVFAFLLLKMDVPCRFTLIDSNPQSVVIGKERTIKAGLDSKVSWLCQDVGDFDERFDIGLATHLCGGATDVAMKCCLLQQAAFIITPCCLGSIKFAIGEERNAISGVVKVGRGYGWNSGKGNSLVYPRSTCFRNQLSVDEYADITTLADCSLPINRSNDDLQMRGKALLDSDRLRLAMEAGYDTSFGILGSKVDCGPKSDVLCGICYNSTRMTDC